MTTSEQRDREHDSSGDDLEQRRDEMKEQEGHAGSVPRGTEEIADEKVREREEEADSALGQ